jgi:hypothetical protein
MPVVIVTDRGPGDAAESTLSKTVADVGEFTASGEANVIPSPKLAFVVPCTKWVFCPVIATDRFCCPCGPLLGFTVSSTGVPGVMINPFGKIATSGPVVTVTVRAPVAEAAIEMLAVRLVALATVTVFTAMSAPKLTCVVP